MAFNLINELSELDKKKLENYVHMYGTKEGFIGVDAWLENWAKNKVKLYKLLGNKFEHRITFQYNKTRAELERQISELVINYREFFNDLIDWVWENNYPDEVTDFINSCYRINSILYDEISEGLKFKLENQRKMLQIQKGAKPVRALGRFLNYCKDEKGIGDLLQRFEKFRIAHSLVFNDKLIKGTLVFSINPIDFVTMSDNNSGWQSCMSWSDNGCYHIGTVEMMNSNNVICCYLENEVPYYFGDANHKTEEYQCRNKKWRQLVYITKDIIVSGKSYPYMNDDMSKRVVETLRELAKENLKWTYSFGIERYQDMKWINGSYSMDRAKGFIHRKMTTKYNILFDSKGMYNDMLNDSNFHYWCVRNKVKHTKVISYSGKAPCLCCGNDVIRHSDYEDDYNERYYDCGQVVCGDCMDLKRCEFCNEADALEGHYKVKNPATREEILVCEHCINNNTRICPECGKPFYVDTWQTLWGYFAGTMEEIRHRDAFIKVGKLQSDEYYNSEIGSFRWRPSMITEKNYFDEYCPQGLIPVCKCNECLDKDPRFQKIHGRIGSGFWHTRETTYYISKDVEDPKNWENTFAYNLKKTMLKEGEVFKS